MVSVKNAGLILALICWAVQASAQNDSVFTTKELSSFRLLNAGNGKSIQPFVKDRGKTLSLYIFLSPECPLSQSYLPLLNSLKKEYENTVTFYGIIPGKAYTLKVVKQFASSYDIQFPLLIDRSKSFTRYMHASITPEVILINDKNLLVYKGAVDDLLTELGKRRIKARNDYLKNALAKSTSNETVTIKRTKAVGCKINDY